MKITSLVLGTFLLYSSASFASNAQLLNERLNQLEQRIDKLEQTFQSNQRKGLWKESILWQRIKIEMSEYEAKQLIGNPNRIEQRIFSSWYYHPTSKLHSYIWFDEGKVLGWKGPE